MLPKDPHLIDSKLFGLPGLTISRGGTLYSMCTNTSEPPHTFCEMYDKEIKHRATIIASGEMGKRDSIGLDDEKNRLGFCFKDTTVTRPFKIKETEDPELKRLMLPGATNFVMTVAPSHQMIEGLSGEEAFSLLLVFQIGAQVKKQPPGQGLSMNRGSGPRRSTPSSRPRPLSSPVILPPRSASRASGTWAAPRPGPSPSWTTSASTPGSTARRCPRKCCWTQWTRGSTMSRLGRRAGTSPPMLDSRAVLLKAT